MVYLMCNTTTPSWLVLTLFKCPYTTDKFKTLGSVMAWWPFWCISCLTPWPLHDLPWFLSPLIQKWITFFTQDIFKILCSVMVQWPFLCILVHFDAFWCIQCVTPWLVHDLLWLPSPFKCPLTPEMDYISHSGQIQNTLLRHGTVTFLCILVHSDAFWCT